MLTVSSNSKFMIIVAKLMVRGANKCVAPASQLVPFYGINKFMIQISLWYK